MNKWLVAIAFSVFLLVPAGAQNAFADSMIIGPGSEVVVKSDASLEMNSDDNTLTNKGTLTVEDGGNVVISNEANFFNDCDATTSLDAGGAMQIGSLGALFATLTNHGSIFGPGQINFLADTIQVKNSNTLTAALNPAVAIMQIASICSTNGGTVVGGVFIPIDTSALLLAGAQTGMFWILPVVIIAGVSFVLIRLKRSEKIHA